MFVVGGTPSNTAVQRLFLASGPQDLVSATVAITGGTFAGDGDVLSFDTTGTSITGSYDAATETLVLTGSDSLAHYQAVLDTVAFSSTSDNPTDFGSDPTRTVTWTVDDGSGPPNDTGTATTTIAVTAINDPPTLSNVAASASYTEQLTAATLSSALSVSDPDSQTLASATVSITGGTFAGDGDVLGFDTTGTSITASYNATTETLVLTGSDTLADYQSVLDKVTFASTSDNPTDFGSDATRTVTWLHNDGAGASNLSSVATTTVNLTAVDDAPTLSPTGTHVTFTVGATVALSPSLSVSDPDNLKLASATVAITGGTFTGDGDVLAATGNGTIAVSYNSATETLVLTGSDTLADYQSVLDSVTFASGPNPNSNGTEPTRTVSWTVNDGTLASSAVTTTLDIAHIPPTLSNVAPSVAFLQGQTVTLSSNVTASDIDSTTLTGATVRITGGTFAGDGDVLAAIGTASIAVSYNAATETLVLTGTDTLAHYQSVLDGVTFRSGANPTNGGNDPTRLVTWVVNDGNASEGLSTAQTTTVSITPLDAPPTLTHVAASAAFTENAAAVTLSPSVTVSDPDAGSFIKAATVQITGGTFAGDGDVLAATGNGTIAVSYDASTESLVLSGSDTLADYQSVLDTVTFVTPSDNPTNFGSSPTRTITWVVNDDLSIASAPATTTLSLTALNDAPSVAAAPSLAFTEGDTVAISPTLSVSDPDSLGFVNATVSITGGTFANDGDVLSASTTGTHITASYDAATETLALTGSDTLANYQSVLDRVTFASGSNPDNNGADPTRTVTWVVNDGSGSSNLSAPATTTIAVTAINDPPQLSNVASSITFTELTTVTLAGNALVSDTDNPNLASATVKIVGGTFAGDGDVLAAPGTASISVSYNAATETLTLTGADTPLHYQQVLDSLTFTSTSHNPDDFGSNPTRTVTWVVNDGSPSNNLSTVATTTIAVTAINDAPTLAGTPASLAFTEGQQVTLAATAAVSDPDNLTLAGATVAITGGTFAGDGDVLTFNTTGTAITASYNTATETLTLTGSDTLADYTQVLDSVTFGSGANPDDFGSQPTRTITWLLDDASGSNHLSTISTTTVNVTAVNNPPTLSGLTNAAFTENGAAVTLSGNASVSDPDNQKLASATIKITGGTFAGDGDVLAAPGTASISVSYNAATETLTLTGSDTLADYRQVLDSVTFNSTSPNPDNFGANPSRTVAWTLNDGSGSNSTTTSTINVGITAINNAPTLAGVPGVDTYTERSAPVSVAPSLALSDPDNRTLVGATVSISNTFANDGDVLGFDTTGTSITASYNDGTEVLTLTGTDTLADYQHVLDSVTFSTPSHNPTNFGSSLSRVLTWIANDGSASNNLSTPQFTTVVITPVNDAPTLSNVVASAHFVPGQLLTVSPAVAIADPDNLKLASATVRVTGGTFAGDGDVLGFSTTGTSITASYNAATETLTLTGSDTLADYQSVLDTVTFTTGGNPTNNGADLTRTLSWTLNDGSASNNLSTPATTTITFQPFLRPVGSGDINGDGKADLVWENTNDGTAVVWLTSAGALTQVKIPNAALGAEWTPSGLGHDGAGHQEIIFSNGTGGQLEIWQLNGTNNLTGAVIPSGKMGAEWHVAAIGDFNGDGSTDVMWENNVGNTSVWSLNGVNLLSAPVGNGVINPTAHVAAVGDFFGTGRDAVLWEDPAGNLQSWSMNGANVVANATVGQIGAEWHVAGEGDFEFNGGGAAGGAAGGKAEDDIVWVDTSNHVMIWQMTNGVISSVVNPSGLDGTEWHLDAVADFTGDGKSDLLWLRADGTAQIWQINGTQAVTSSLVNGPGDDTLQLSSGAAPQPAAAQATTSNATTSNATTPNAVTPTAMVASTGDVPAFAVMSSPDVASAAPPLTMQDIVQAIGAPAQTTLGFAPNGTAGALAPGGDATDASLALLGNYMAASFATPGNSQSGPIVGDPQPAGSLLVPPVMTHQA